MRYIIYILAIVLNVQIMFVVAEDAARPITPLVESILPASYNEYDSCGQKTGYWIEFSESGYCTSLTITHYENGRKNGWSHKYNNVSNSNDIYSLMRRIPNRILFYRNDTVTSSVIYTMDRTQEIITGIEPTECPTDTDCYDGFDRSYFLGTLSSMGQCVFSPSTDLFTLGVYGLRTNFNPRGEVIYTSDWGPWPCYEQTDDSI